MKRTIKKPKPFLPFPAVDLWNGLLLFGVGSMVRKMTLGNQAKLLSYGQQLLKEQEATPSSKPRK